MWSECVQLLGSTLGPEKKKYLGPINDKGSGFVRTGIEFFKETITRTNLCMYV